MIDENELSQQLENARREKERLRQLQFEARERVKRLEREQQQLQRRFNADSAADQTLLSTLREQLEAANERANAASQRFDRIVGVENELFGAYQVFTDPRQRLGQFNERFPFLLLPLRIETRFKQEFGQLWLRVYPDDCEVDSFEPTLSETEVSNARAFWAGMWAAGNIPEGEAQERAAWRGLVASHGAGRARWIIEHYTPINPAAQPTKADPTDVILAIPTNSPAAPAVASALLTYWLAAWLADGDRTLLLAALAALSAQVGGDEIANDLILRYRPVNFSETPADKPKNEVALSAIFVEFPTADDFPTKQDSWSQSAKTHIMPDRLVVIAYDDADQKVVEQIGNPIPSPLVLSPDPSGDAKAQFNTENGELIIGEEMRWMTDFDRAVEVGMGFRIRLTDVQMSRGFKRLLVLGVRLNNNPQDGRQQLETLLRHHHLSNKGLSLLPQGTPTNNTEEDGSGYTKAEDADDTFELYVKGIQGTTLTTDELIKSDGQHFGEALGIDLDFALRLPNASGSDQTEAKAMNFALFPATLGYMMNTMIKPGPDLDDQALIRRFYAYFVSGRGAVPAIRIGNQPYGILPTTVFSRMNWLRRGGIGVADRATSFQVLVKIREVIESLKPIWQNLARNVDHVGKQGDNVDAHKVLLSVLGLHPSSVEYHARYAQSESHFYNLMNLQASGGSISGGQLYLNAQTQWMQTTWEGLSIDPTLLYLRSIGYPAESTPLLTKLRFWNKAHRLKGAVIDDRPLSETELIRAYTPAPERNYLQWLLDAATTSLDALRKQEGFLDNTPPTALLYLVMRYALINSFHDESLTLQISNQLLTMEAALARRVEPEFVHVAVQEQVSESRWTELYKPAEIITNSPTLTLGDYIAQNVRQFEGPSILKEHLEALERLVDVPTARLERLFAEHLDTVSYRLDAWILSWVHYQLKVIRAQHYADNDEPNGGVFLGAYGWLEEVRPENKQFEPVRLPPDLHAVFNFRPNPDPEGEPIPIREPLLREIKNANLGDYSGGYVHAPSLDHAVTAAVLRNGYLSKTSPEAPELFAVNLSSERVRLALSFIEGIRNGQSLGALLGYQLERGLHDRYQQAEVDEFIYDLRKAFPLRALHLKRTTQPGDNAPDAEDASIEALEARNVVDGLELIEHVKKTGNKIYPFGKGDVLPEADDDQEAAINAEVERLLDIHDALADLALAEGIHQVVQGNYDRAAATTDAYGKSSYPPIPDVVQTPRSGTTLTHRIGLQLESGLDSVTSPVTGLTMTPRAQAEPALNKWLAGMLPAQAGDLACQVVIINPIDGTESPPEPVTWDNLDLQPIDLLYLIQPQNEQAMAELDDRIVHRIRSTQNLRPDVEIRILYTQATADATSFFQAAPLIQSLRSLVLASRPLIASDVMLTNEAADAQSENVTADPQRIILVRNALSDLRDDLRAYQAVLDAIFVDVAAVTPQLIDDIDTHAQNLLDMLVRAATLAIPRSGWGFIYNWKRILFTQLLTLITERITPWDTRLVEFDALIAEYNALAPATAPEVRFELLTRAELLVTTQITTPLPADPDDLRDTLVGTSRAAFQTKRDALASLLNTNTSSVTTLYNAIQAQLPLTGFDTTEPDFTAFTASVVAFAGELRTTATLTANDADKRIAAAQSRLDAHDTASKPSGQVKALQDAAKALLGDDFRFIPEFTLDSAQRTEWSKAFTASQNGNLFQYLKPSLPTGAGTDLLVDEWLYGAARVREKLGHWERVMMLASAIGRDEPLLTPVQFPYADDASWMALQFNPAQPRDQEYLLYTAHYANWNPNANQCGLLLDEWTEVLPNLEEVLLPDGSTEHLSRETTGITFHYDRPNSEPPQSILLVTSARFSDGWTWDDLVDALVETLDLARLRAVDADQVAATTLNRLLPATLMGMTFYEQSISANLAINNNVHYLITQLQG
jgi:hypothetical protein